MSNKKIKRQIKQLKKDQAYVFNFLVTHGAAGKEGPAGPQGMAGRDGVCRGACCNYGKPWKGLHTSSQPETNLVRVPWKERF